jgi:TDG/mug DNA glycosylase family protein
MVMAIAKTSGMHRPTRAELLAAHGKTVPDVIAHDLRVLFCGINPGLYSAATKHHFARPGNRFWPALHQSGFTPQLLRPDEEEQLLALGFGITNLVARGTAGADELSREELVAGQRKLASKAKRFAPRFIAILGIGAYRAAFERPDATLGLQAALLGDSQVWVLPNPSGLNAHYSLPECVRLFKDLRRAARRANVRHKEVRAVRRAALRARGR